MERIGEKIIWQIRPISITIWLHISTDLILGGLGLRSWFSRFLVFVTPRMLLAAFFLSLCCFRPVPRCPRRRPITKKFSRAPPRLDQPYSEAPQGLLHFFQQQREQTLVTLCYWDFLGHSQSELVHFLALPSYYFWLLENPVLFQCICSAACIKL